MPYCTEEGCDIHKPGYKCLNQFTDLSKCPHYSPNDQLPISDFTELPDTDNSDDNVSVHKDLNVVHTYSGSALNMEEVNQVSLSNISRLVIFAGMPNVGKTTFLLSLIQLFETKQSFCDFLFAGSRTLLEFEEKSFDSKIESGRETEDTARTRIGPVKFLHLNVASEDLSTKLNLLFTDISGEAFVAMRDSTEECKKFTLAQRADHFVLFLDSKLLSDLVNRATAKIDGLGILRGLIEAGSIQKGTYIQIIFSRWDLLDERQNNQQHKGFIHSIKEEITSRFGNDFEIEFFEICSRPKIGSPMPFGYGFDKIFPLWIQKSLSSTVFSGHFIGDEIKRLSDKPFLQYKFIS